MSSRPLHIFIAEDNPADIELVREALFEFGFCGDGHDEFPEGGLRNRQRGSTLAVSQSPDSLITPPASASMRPSG